MPIVSVIDGSADFIPLQDFVPLQDGLSARWISHMANMAKGGRLKMRRCSSKVWDVGEAGMKRSWQTPRAVREI